MDKRETSEPLYSFDYILNPAKNWGDFKPKYYDYNTTKSPTYCKEQHQVYYGENNTYTATLSEPLKLTCHLHSTLMRKSRCLDKIQGKLGRNLWHFTFLLIYAIVFMIIGIIIVKLILRSKKKRYI